MAYDDVQTTPSFSRTKTPITARPRWRQSTRRRPPVAVAPDPEVCAVAAMASEAAAVLRLKRQLHPESADADTALIAALTAPDDFLRPGELAESLWDRFLAIEHMVSHRRATSLKGALFQLYVAACRSQHPAGHLVTKLNWREERDLEQNDRHVGRLHHAAIAHLETQVEDEDLIELRRWYFTPLYDVGRACEQGLYDRAALVMEARRLPVTPAVDPA